MKLNYKLKLYLYIFAIFLVVFNGGIFTVAAVQNSKTLTAQKENCNTQNTIILQQILSDIQRENNAHSSTIPYVIKNYGSMLKFNSIYIQVKQKDEFIYSSFEEYVEEADIDNTVSKSYIKTIDNKKLFLVFSKLPKPYDNYYVVTGFNFTNLFKDWKETINNLIILSVIFCSFMAIVLYLSINKLTKPLQLISSASNRFGSGDFSVRIKELSKDDLGDTAKNFNIMADKITFQLQMLEKAASEKQMLIDDLSHEMRTPLTAIRGYVQYMQTAKLNTEEYYEILNIIDKQSVRLQKLSEVMLSFTNLQNNDSTNEKIIISTVAQNVLESYLAKARVKNIRLELIIDKDFTFFANKELLESLIGNLVDNALNACAETNNAVVKIIVENKKITIADNGIGMSKEIIDNIYTPFFRADKSRSRKNGGVGLGAALCKKIADMYKIEIQYSSKLNAGTTVALHFTTL